MKIIKNKILSISVVLLIGWAMAVTEAPAAVIYNDFNGTPLSYTAGMTPVPDEVLFTLDLPGAASIAVYQLDFNGHNVFQLYQSGGFIEFPRNWYPHANSSLAFVETLEEGESWSDWPGTLDHWGNVSTLNRTTGSTFMLREYPTFIPFRFADTTDNNETKFGYIETDTVLSGSGNDSLLTWTIYSYAYESNVGQEISMGQMDDMGAVVPEPSTVLMLVLGCLVVIGYRRTKHYRQGEPSR